jgi:hypothetical protein
MNLRLTILLATSLLGTGVFAEVAPAPQPKVERAAMTDEQRAQIEQRLNEVWSKLSVREKSQLMKLQHALREMPPEERKFIHDRVERFLNMSPEERQKLNENHDRWQKMTAEERQQAREKFSQHRKEFEEKWRREHPGEEPPPFPFHKGRSGSPTTPPVQSPAAPE